MSIKPMAVEVAPARVEDRAALFSLVEAAGLPLDGLDLAKRAHTPAIYLLTTTADEFFQKFGFERITRSDVPDDVRTSVEFTSVCPDTAVVMRKVILS